MGLHCVSAGFVSLLALAVANPTRQPADSQQQPAATVQPPLAVSGQPSAAAQLAALLSPAVEGAVSRAQSGWQLARLAGRLDRLETETGTGQRALTELTRQQRDAGCEPHPAALPAGVATYQEPAQRACARSCLQLKHQGVTEDGTYWLTGLPVPVLCDFSHDDGGWTLLLTAVSRVGWDPYSVLGRSQLSPSLTDNYSILKHANTIRDLGTSDRFAYRIETKAEQGRQRWGGVWFAPRRYSFVDETGTQTEVSLMRRFDNWVYKSDGIKRRMPWINTAGHHAMKPILTTCETGGNFWGTMVTHHSHPAHQHSPWLHPQGHDSGIVLYWMREDAM